MSGGLRCRSEGLGRGNELNPEEKQPLRCNRCESLDYSVLAYTINLQYLATSLRLNEPDPCKGYYVHVPQ